MFWIFFLATLFFHAAVYRDSMTFGGWRGLNIVKKVEKQLNESFMAWLAE